MEIKVWKYNFKEDENTEENSAKRDTTITIIIDTTIIGGKMFIDTGKVTTVSHTLQSSHTNSRHQDTVLWRIEQYNTEGMLVEQEGYFMDIDYNAYKRKNFIYDNQNRLIEQVELSKDRKTAEIFKYTFNDRDKTVRLDRIEYERIVEYTIWRYNKGARIVSVVDYWGDGRIEKTSTYKYSWYTRRVKYKNSDLGDVCIYMKRDKADRIIKWSLFHMGRKDSEYFTYNKKGKISEEKKILRAKGAMKVTTSYKYDVDGNLLFIYESNNDGIERIIQENGYRNGLLDYSLYYDKKGLPEGKMTYEYKLRE